MILERVIIVGGPRCGKSTLARDLRGKGFPTFCGDPRSLVKEPEDGVTYLPEGLSWSEGSLFVAEYWFTLPGPWVCEGQVMARALRKFPEAVAPCDRIIVLLDPHPAARPTPGQLAMGKGVRTVWEQIEHRFLPIAEYR